MGKVFLGAVVLSRLHFFAQREIYVLFKNLGLF